MYVMLNDPVKGLKMTELATPATACGYVRDRTITIGE